MKIQTLFGSLEELERKERERQEGKSGFFDRMKEAVSKTRDNLSERIEEIVYFNEQIDARTLDDLEASLIAADLGTATTHEVLEKLRERATHKQIADVDELKRLLKEQIFEILTRADGQPPAQVQDEPLVILVVGVNGTGKTTTIGKIAGFLKQHEKTVLLCAADTFRAAAIEQLEIWGQRTGAEV